MSVVEVRGSHTTWLCLFLKALCSFAELQPLPSHPACPPICAFPRCHVHEQYVHHRIPRALLLRLYPKADLSLLLSGRSKQSCGGTTCETYQSAEGILIEREPEDCAKLSNSLRRSSQSLFPGRRQLKTD